LTTPQMLLYPPHTMSTLPTDPHTLTVAEAWSNERAFRLALGNMLLRTLERLEAEFLSNRTLPSSSAALAKELRQGAQYLEELQDRLLKHPQTSGPEAVERLLLRLNELTGQLQKLRAPSRRAKGIRTGGPSGDVVEVAEEIKASPVPGAHAAEEPGAQVAESREASQDQEGMDREGGKGDVAEGGR
jgi:hypothetical protein